MREVHITIVTVVLSHCDDVPMQRFELNGLGEADEDGRGVM